MEDSYEGESEFHGAGGEWKVNQQRLSWDILDSFRDATIEAGIPKIDDFNEGNNFGVSYFKVNQNCFQEHLLPLVLKVIELYP